MHNKHILINLCFLIPGASIQGISLKFSYLSISCQFSTILNVVCILQLAAEYVEKALFKKIMTKLLDGSMDEQMDSGDIKSRGEAIHNILRTSHLEVDESLLKLLKSAYDGSGNTSGPKKQTVYFIFS